MSLKGIVSGVILIILTTAIHRDMMFSPLRDVKIRCNDSTFSQRYTGDTLNAYLLFFTCLVPTLAVIHLSVLQQSGSNVAVQTWNLYERFLLGFLLQLLLNVILKCVVVEPRPHFWDTCNPLEDGLVNCNEGHEYIRFDLKFCRQSSLKAVSDSLESFPSGHAQLSVFTAWFSISYLHMHTKVRSHWYILNCIFWIVVALSMSLSRIYDNRHHWWDVLAGALIGSIFAIITMKVGFSNGFEKRKEKKFEEENEKK